MPDETREPQDAPQEEPAYQAPKAEELPEAEMGAASGPGTAQDGQGF